MKEARKGYIPTPVGYMPVPSDVQRSMDKTETLELVKQYIERCKAFVDPFLLNELAYRGVMRRGMKYQDVVDLYHRMLDSENEIKEEEKATCSLCGETYHENEINMIDYDIDLCVSCEKSYIGDKKNDGRHSDNHRLD